MLARTRHLAEANCRTLAAAADLGVIHFVTPGESPLYFGSAATADPSSPMVCIHSFPLRFEMWRRLLIEGAHVVTPSVRHVPPQCVDPKMKNRSRLHWFLADRQTHALDPSAISLLLDLDGNETECAGANFVIVQDDTIVSPTRRNILWGVSLETVRELAPGCGLRFVERDFQPYDIVNADEAWLTTTPYCVAPCTRINGTPVGAGTRGPAFGRMLEAWSELVGLDVGAQILGESAP